MASKRTAGPGCPFSDRQIADYERMLLGAYILGAPIGRDITGNVFLSGAHRAVFPVIRELKTRGIELNDAILVSELRNRNLLDMAGGAASVADLTSGVISTVNAGFYENEVLTAFRGREVWKAAALAKEALEKGNAPDTVSAALAASIEGITASGAHGSEDKGVLFRDLLARQFPPEDWFIDGLITTGLTVLTGASKIGKSWTALQLVAALDQGGYFLGTLKARKCDALYCALEDTPKRIQKRILKQGVTAFNGSRLETKRRTPEDLRAFLKANPQFRIVIIDTFQKMMGIADLNDYSQTVNGMSTLKDIADSLNIAVIVIHHNRKGGDLDGDHMESALGSTGINATADTTLTMRRKRGTAEASLSATGRDVEDAAYTLSWDKDVCSWSITGQGALKPVLSEAQQQIIDLLESEARNWTTGEIVEAAGKSYPAVGNILKRLQETGRIESPDRGQWRTKNNITISHLPRESEIVILPDTAEPAQEALAAPAGTPVEEPAIW
jgi:replicative DNA helicase/DNA-binding transcriptional ArsR family regulator